MNGKTHIQYLHYNEIDKHKWDHCIDNATNGLIYSYSFYLDHMSLHWDALVLNDYEAVMPLTWNRKYGCYYLYQPFCCASLGVFGKDINAGILETFLSAIPRKFRFWDIYFNHGNFFTLPGFKLYERMNYVLDLTPSYETIYSRFRDNIKRNIKKSEQLGCTLKTGFPVKEVIQLAQLQAQTIAGIKAADFVHFENLYDHLRGKNAAITYGIYSADGALMSSCVFFFSHQRAYYILVGNHPNSKIAGTSHALINAFIKDHCGRNLLLDFEGSDIRNLAFFYSSFGSVEEKYSAIRYNHLPLLVRWMKK